MRHVLVAGAAAAALLMAGAVPRPAEALPVSNSQVGSDTGSGVTLAKRGGRGGGMGRGFRGGFKGGGKSFRSFGGGGRKFGGGGGYGKRHFKGGHRHRGPRIRVRPRYYGYAPYYYGYYDSYYGDSCAWLRRKAMRTGSSYWWRRYEDCREDYY